MNSESAQSLSPGGWHCRGRILPRGEKTLIMGVLNVTPDSFFDGGRHASLEAAIDHAAHMMEAGADIIDVGGESSRPGAEPVSAAEEEDRVLPVIEALHQQLNCTISVDTTKTAVAQAAVQSSAHIINDISAGRGDDAMLELARESGAGLVLMHMQGMPRTMQEQPTYEDVVAEVRQFLVGRLWKAEAAGVSRASIAIDPGIGFGKTFEHNWELLRHLDALIELEVPVLVGVSRKRFLGALCDRPVDDRLAASLAAATAAALAGAEIIRVHDVKETCDALRVADKLQSR